MSPFFCYLEHYGLDWWMQQGYNICLMCGMSIGLVGITASDFHALSGASTNPPSCSLLEQLMVCKHVNSSAIPALDWGIKLQNCSILEKKLQDSMRALNIIHQVFMWALCFLILVTLLMDSFAVNVVEKVWNQVSIQLVSPLQPKGCTGSPFLLTAKQWRHEPVL